jgi:hypothetical protein
MVSDLLCHFEFAAVLQIRRNAGRTEGMIANPRFDAGRFEIVVQVLIETMMTRDVVLLAAFFV